MERSWYEGKNRLQNAVARDKTITSEIHAIKKRSRPLALVFHLASESADEKATTKQTRQEGATYRSFEKRKEWPRTFAPFIFREISPMRKRRLVNKKRKGRRYPQGKIRKKLSMHLDSVMSGQTGH